MSYLMSYDLGTGGIKASIHQEDGRLLRKAFQEYATRFPSERRQEQSPQDWWQAVCDTTARLLAESGIPAREVRAVALSGQSLVALPLDKSGRLLLDSVPIWSDTRATAEAEEFFTRIAYDDWYGITGNGDPPETYSIMKLMWMKKNQPEIWARTDKIVGSKDYVNFRLTGVVATDPSYASGSGLFDLKSGRYRTEYLEAADIDANLVPEIRESHAVVGTVTPEASVECGLAAGTLVACGGVDNACMALGARGIGEGRVYTSLGSSCWIAVTSATPVLDRQTRPFVFAHVEKGYFTSGVSIFAAGRAYRWARDVLCRDLSGDAYSKMDELAATVPAGSRGVLFNPTLAGGSSQNASTDLQGSFSGITLSTTRDDLLRAVLEGVALDLGCYCLGALQKQVRLEDRMLLCGGGARSPLWRQIFADVFGMPILKSSVDQDAASLGAAAIAARAAGFWSDYSRVDALHRDEGLQAPDLEHQALYAGLKSKYRAWTDCLADLKGRRTS